MKISKFLPLGGAILSAILLTLAFPRTDIWWLGWVGLIPLMRALDTRSPGAAFGLAYVCGLLFFGGTLYWFIHVTILGAFLLNSYLALYFGLFGLSYSFFRRHTPLQKLFLIPCAWVVLEYVRAHWLSGLGWAILGQSQYKNLAVIQIAEVTGVWGVSFLLVMVNYVLKEILGGVSARGHSGEGTTFSQRAVCGGVAIVAVTLALGYGWICLNRPGEKQGLSVAVIQANIAQDLKWRESSWPTIMKKYMALTAQAAAENPQLIVWPETAFPGFLWEDQELFEELRSFVRRLQIPLLFGSVVTREGAYYNSALLLSGEGDVLEEYHKIHLVPFGEFVPLRAFFPFLSDLVPIADFTAGDQFTVFPYPPEGEKKKIFSVLICFEDTVARLAREFVKRDARLLINLTNDAWFHDTKEPFMHLSASVFRTVENRRSLLRAANTGVSCFLDPYGRVLGQVQDPRHKTTYVEGYAMATVPLNTRLTLYTRFGDFFVFLCIGGMAAGILRSRGRNSHGREERK